MTLEAWVRPTALGSQWRAVAVKEQSADLVYGLFALLAITSGAYASNCSSATPLIE